MTAWTSCSYNVVTKSADCLVNLSVDLQRQLGAHGTAASPQEILFLLAKVSDFAKSMTRVIDDGIKVAVLLSPC